MTPPLLAQAKAPTLAFLRNELRRAERDWQGHSRFDHWPGGNPWAAHRDEAAARHSRIRSEIARFGDLVAAQVDAIHRAAAEDRALHGEEVAA